MSAERTREPARGSIRSGVAWKALSQVTLQISRMVVALVLARMLAPDDWGLAAMVLVFSGFVVVFTDNSLGTALIQRRELLPRDRSTVFWINASIGVILMLIGFAIAAPIANFYGEPQVRGLFMALSVGFFISAAGTTQAALLARDMRFRQLELRQIAATLVGATTAIAVALKGFGAWAIVAQQLAEVTTSTVLLWCLVRWKPSLTLSIESVRRLGGFAGNVFAENLLYQAGRSLGSIVVGRSLGAASLGTFALATNVILVPFTRIAAPLQQVFLPAFSRMTDRDQVADVWVRATRLVGAVSFPALVGVAIVAPEFVEVVLGDEWSGAARIIQILALAGLVQSVQTLAGEVLLALGRAATLTFFTLLWFAGSLGALAIGLRWGITGVAVSQLVVTLLLEPVRTLLTTRALGISFWCFPQALLGVAQATTAMAFVLLATRAALEHTGTPAAAQLIVLVALGALAYVGACMWRAPDVSLEVRRVIGRRGSGHTPASGALEPGL